MPILQGIAAAPSPPHHAQYGNASASSSTSAYNGSQHHPQQQHHAQHPNALAGNGMSVAGPSSSSHQPSASLTAPTTAASLMREGPRDFTVIKAVGDGSFGTVCLADWKSPLPSGTMLSPMQHPTTRPEYVGKRLVAIKRMKKPFKSWNDCMRLKELKSLLDIPHHPNIIPLYDAFLDPTSKELHFVFECMEGNLYQLTKSRKGRPLAGGLVASIFKQIISGLHHIHSHGYFHRDMKPENLLITTTGLDDYPASKAGAAPERDVIVIVKLADFGLARETASVPPYTEYVSTRWYRAPEVLLRSRDYSNPVDMWALGTILAELVNLKPLFPGESEVDQVTQICEVLGDPSPDYGVDSKGRVRGGGPWERGIRMAASVGFQWPRVPPIKFASLFSSRVPMQLIQCIEDLLRYDPHRRATTADCIAHPYFSQIAPRLLPIKGRAPAAAASRAPAPAPLGVDPTAARSALPPSHSHMAPNARPAFGEASPQQQRDASSQQRIPFYRPPQPQQPQQPHLQHSQQRIEESLPIYRGGGGGYPEHQYPNVPESVSMQSMSSQQGSDMQDYGNAAAPPAGPWLSVPSQGSRNPSFSLTRPTQQQLGVAAAGAYSGESFPRGSFDAQSSVSGPVDPKKAKKEADKAAKQAEKAKRLAQEKAARDRARAVMQKRNQILAASTVKEQVEWLSSSSPPGPGGRQSDKSRGKQSTSNASSQSSQAPGLSPLESPNSPYSPSPYSPAHRGPPPSQFFEMRDNGRPISMQSYATGDSDPGPQGRRQMAGYPNHLQRQGSASSLSSGLDIMAAQHHQPQGYHPGRLYHASQGGSFDSFRSGGHGGEGSLDHQLVSNMEAMSAAERQSGSVSPAPIHLIGGRPSISRQSGKSRSRASSIHRAGSASPLHHTMAPRFHPYGLSGPPPPSSHSQSSSHSHFSGGIHLPSLQQSLEEERRRSGASLPRPAGPGRRSSQSQSRPNASQGSAWSAGAAGESTVGGGGGPAYGYHSPPPGAPVNLHYGRGGSGSDGSGGGGERGVNPMWGGGYASDHRGPYEQSGGGPVGSSPVPNPSPSGFGQGGRLPPISTLMSAAEGGEDRGGVGGGGGGGEAMDSEMSYYDGAHRQQAGYPQQQHHQQQQHYQQQQHPQYQQYQHQQQTSPLAHRR